MCSSANFCQRGEMAKGQKWQKGQEQEGGRERGEGIIILALNGDIKSGQLIMKRTHAVCDRKVAG